MSKKHESTNLKVADAPTVPASKSLTAWWRQFSTLERDADEIHAAWLRLCSIRRNLSNPQPDDEPPKVTHAELSESVKTILPRARAALAQIDSDDYYDTDEDDQRVLKKRIIGERLALMLGAMSLGAPKTDADVFARMLLEHVRDAAPSLLTLESACRQIEAKQKFSATISEVLAVIAECAPRWGGRRFAIGDIEKLSAKLCVEIATMRPKFELERARASVQQAQRACSHQRLIAVQKQNQARYAFQAVERAMAELAENEQAFKDAKEAEAKAATAAPQTLLPKVGDA